MAVEIQPPCNLTTSGTTPQLVSAFNFVAIWGLNENNISLFVLWFFEKVPLNMTLSSGAPIDDLSSMLSVGPRGPVLLQDYSFIQQIQHFDRERIPERVVHGKGSGNNYSPFYNS
jgi:hypothetical protein